MSTLADFRRATAPKLGPFTMGTATGGSSSSVLEAAAWPFLTSLEQSDLFADQFIFRPSAAASGDRTRLVANGGYVPSTGKLTPDKVWTNSPSGEVFELHGVIPPVADGVNDLHAFINEGLKDCLLVVEFSFTPGSVLANRHSLAVAAPWLTEPSWVLQVGYLASGESRTEHDPFRRPRRMLAKKDGATVYLEGAGFNTTDTVYVTALKRAYDHCRPSAGTYGSQSGLSLETDEAVPEADWVAAATERIVWDRLADVLAPGNAKRAEQKRAEAAAEFTRKQQNYLAAHRPASTLRPPMMAWGPRR